jgi:methylenetetrahydrofolate reductase (NADPH)
MSLRERLAAGGFAVTAEISPPRGASMGPITQTAALLRDWVDAVNVTDNQGSNVRLASWAGRLGKKVEAGAQFVQTQFVFDTHAFGQWMAQVRDLGLHERCYILAGVGAVRSRRALDFMRDKVPGVQVPDDVYRRLRAVPADQTAAEGARLAAEIIQQLSAIEGVAGVHLLVAGNEQEVPGILDGAGVRAARDER